VTEEWTTRHPGLPLLLFGDRCSEHMSAETLERALRRALYLFFLIANASHFLQPLDDEPFACFHQLLREKNESYVFDALLSGHATRNALLAAAYHSERRDFTPHVVSKAFILTGLWPFNPEVFLDRAFENLGVVAPGLTVRVEARLMAADTIAAARRRSEKTAKGVSSGTVAVQRGALHSPYLLLKEARKSRRRGGHVGPAAHAEGCKDGEEGSEAQERPRGRRSPAAYDLSYLRRQPSPWGGGVEGLSLWPLASVSQVQGYSGGRLSYCGAHREVLCWLRRGLQVVGGS